jgi:hypothetical protein
LFAFAVVVVLAVALAVGLWWSVTRPDDADSGRSSVGARPEGKA